ncbi:MAG: methyl-accepting chemotaxis protein [Desulfobacterales bacterium]|nr:methyl-accepting chemotaxis protein [Desulfobacterales bacterium]
MREKLSGLSDVILKMGHIINDSLDATKDITVKAQRGEVSLKNMEQNVAKIRESSQEMTNIVGIINDISDQINLLSLNAAIEAARAGDTGRGFAVVADEISKLADKTASSIKEIKALITTNENETQKGMGVIKDTVEIISTIVSGVNTINEKISNLVLYRDKQTETNLSVTESVEKLKERSGHIALAAEEQKNGIGEILKHISEINDISTSNTASGAEKATSTPKSCFSR